MKNLFLTLTLVVFSQSVLSNSFSINGVSPNNQLNILESECSEKMDVHYDMTQSFFGRIKVTFKLFRDGTLLRSESKVMWGINTRFDFNFQIDPLPGNYHAEISSFWITNRITADINVVANCVDETCCINPASVNIFSSHNFITGDGSGIHKYPALVGNFNGDNKDDIAFVGQDWNWNGLNIRIKNYVTGGNWNSTHQVLGDGSGVHKYPTLIGDFNGDNRDDIVFLGQNWSGNGLNIRMKK